MPPVAETLQKDGSQSSQFMQSHIKGAGVLSVVWANTWVERRSYAVWHNSRNVPLEPCFWLFSWVVWAEGAGWFWFRFWVGDFFCFLNLSCQHNVYVFEKDSAAGIRTYVNFLFIFTTWLYLQFFIDLLTWISPDLLDIYSKQWNDWSQMVDPKVGQG